MPYPSSPPIKERAPARRVSSVDRTSVNGSNGKRMAWRMSVPGTNGLSRSALFLLAAFLLANAIGAQERTIPLSQEITATLARSLPLHRTAREMTVFCLTLTNRTDTKLTLEYPWPMVNFTVTASRDGVPLKCLLRQPAGIAGTSGAFELQARESRVVTFDAREWFELSGPGEYEIEVRFSLTHLMLPHREGRVVPDERVVAREKFHFTQRDFPVNLK